MVGNKSELKKDGVTQNVRYYHGNYEKLDTYTGGVVTATKHIYYISGGNGLCAIATKEGTNPTVTYNYVYTDHLGSILKLTNNIGVVTAEQSFDAWGRLRNPNNWNDYSSTGTAQPIGSPLGAGGGGGWLTRGYTGHEHVPQVDLINMNGRMYDALLGRMLSPDRYVQDATSTQAYNRYSYVMNNPLKYTDPSGWIAYNKQREYAMEPDPNNYRSGTGGSVGNWGFYANGGASSYNYSGPYSLYASNPAQYASTYGSQTWMQQETASAYEAQKRAREGNSSQTENSYTTTNSTKIASILGMYGRGNDGNDIYDVMTGEGGITIYGSRSGSFITDMNSLNRVWNWIQDDLNGNHKPSANAIVGFAHGVSEMGVGFMLSSSAYKTQHLRNSTQFGMQGSTRINPWYSRFVRQTKIANISSTVGKVLLPVNVITTGYTWYKVGNQIYNNEAVNPLDISDATVGTIGIGMSSIAIFAPVLISNPVGWGIAGGLILGYGAVRIGMDFYKSYKEP